jgi:eukaryotic-like serine/threonine-protein kinase
MGDGSVDRLGAGVRTRTDTPPSERTSTQDVVGVWLSHTPGDRIADKYLLLRILEHGGMGVVWVAHHVGLDIHVALKLVRPEVDSGEMAERLVVEAQAAARLDHPAIVHVLDVGRTAEGDPFLVMELLDGETLADVLDREARLDVVTAIQVLLPIAGGLGVMHGKGIVHRDVKPENVFLSCDDTGRWQPKVIDLGVARLEGRSRAGRLTRRGAVLGTPVYLSPERVEGEDADPRDDVWALCVMLYEVVAGVRPFDGDTLGDLLAALVTTAPRPLASRGVDAPELWTILERGLRRRDARWPSMQDLGKALAGELWRRGVTQDISGVSLRATWLRDVSLPAAPSTPAPPPAAPALRRPTALVTSRLLRPALNLPPPPAAPPSPAPSIPPPAVPAGAVGGPRLTPAIGLALVMLGMSIGLVAGMLIEGRSAASAPADGGPSGTAPPR